MKEADTALCSAKGIQAVKVTLRALVAIPAAGMTMSAAIVAMMSPPS